MSDSDSDIEIIDITSGISASTSPMLSPPLRERLRRKMGRVLDLDDSSDEEKKEEFVAVATSEKARRPRRAHRRASIEEKGDDDFVPLEESSDSNKETKGTIGATKTLRPRRARDSTGAKGGRPIKEASEEKHEDEAEVTDEGGTELFPSSSFSVAKNEDNSKLNGAYLKARRNAVKKRSFDIGRIPASEIIPTGRTIKRMSAWSGRWPALREFLQNTIDHLGLLDPRTGRRHGALRLDVTPGTSGDELATFHFLCGDEAVCKIVAFADELVIDQLYTFPIAPRALDTGVPDTDKLGASAAGGFGDGFKTAAVALLALGKDFGSLTWDFFSQGQKITWTFEGATRAAVGTFARCQVLQVRIDRTDLPEDVSMDENLMRQSIKVKGIGKSFLEQAVPRLVVFWDLDEPTLVCSRKKGGDFIALASAQPAIAGGVLGQTVRPESGIYVKGIWVRKPKITGTLMCFFGCRLEVNGRDRNDVDEEDLVNALVFVFHHCDNLGYLRKLLAPLRGKAHSTGPTGESGSSSRSSRGQGNSDSSWLLKSPRFMNQILEQHKDFILHEVLGVPPGAIYVSSKTTNSSDPFIKWASEFLNKCGCPLEPIEPGANRYLFQEASEIELTEHCVKMLKQQKDKNGSDSDILSKAFRKVLFFMGLGRAKVFFSSHIAVAFVHNRDIYVPETSLTRELLVKVLNVCQCHLDGADGERFSCLLQAVFEVLPPGKTRELAIDDVDKSVSRAKSVLKENKNFLVKPTGEGSSSTTSKPPPPPQLAPEIDLTGDDDPPCTGHHHNHHHKQPHDRPSTAEDLLRQISEVTRKAEGGRKRRKNHGNDDYSDLQPIIPASDFGNDDAGNDNCLRPSSQLQSVQVDGSLGGGIMLCDASAAAKIHNKLWDTETKAGIASLRKVLGDSIDMVRQGIPSLDALLRRVRHGYDASNNTYEAFCDGTQIVVNLYAFMPVLENASTGVSSPPTLIHDFVIVITHELAHFLEPAAGHGPAWRDAHMKMVTQVMAMLSSTNTGNPGSGKSNKRQRKT